MCWGVMPSGMLRHPFSRLGALSMPGHKNHERRGGSTLVGVICRSASKRQLLHRRAWSWHCTDLAAQGRDIPIHPFASDLSPSVLRNVTAVYARSAPTSSGNTHHLPFVVSRAVPSRNDVFTARDHLLDVTANVRKRFEVHLHRFPGAISAT